MKRLPRPALFALGAVTTLMLGGTAYAANGGNLLIGRSNSASAVTTLSNSTGSAMQFNSASGSPSFRVNRSTKVPNLNADLLDNLDSAALALKTGRTGIIVGSPSDADGFVETASCPSSTYATGGGGIATNPSDYLWYSGPNVDDATGNLIPNSWLALADGSSVAWVVCYNPRGGVPGAATSFGAAMAAAQSQAASAPRKEFAGLHR